MSKYNGINSDIILFNENKEPKIIRFSAFLEIFECEKIDEIKRNDETLTEVYAVKDNVYCLSKEDENKKKLVFNKINRFYIHKNLKFLKKITYKSSNKFNFKPFTCSNKFSLVLYDSKKEYFFNGDIYHLNNKESNNDFSLIQYLKIPNLEIKEFENELELNFRLGYFVGAWIAEGKKIKYNQEYKTSLIVNHKKDNQFLKKVISQYGSSLRQDFENEIYYILLEDQIEEWLNDNFTFKVKNKRISDQNKTLPDWAIVAENNFIEGIFSALINFNGDIVEYKGEYNVLIKTNSKYIANRFTTLVKLKFGALYYIEKNQNEEYMFRIYFNINESILEMLKYSNYLEATLFNDINEELINQEDNKPILIDSNKINVHNVNEEDKIYNFGLNTQKNFITIDGILVNSH